ncbi:MAG TPA: pyridoxamine 5'-phosphate oxidase family protein [Acidimicrobiales bacterium]
MASWNDLAAAAPDLAERTMARFRATGLAILATIRRDGSPRLTGIEVTFRDGDLWLGMMDGSLKALDLRRDPRLALHAATVDKEVRDGDAKVAGRAVEVLDEDVKARFLEHVEAENGQAPPGPYHLFRVDVSEVSFLRPAGDHLVIETWTEGGRYRSVDRY